MQLLFLNAYQAEREQSSWKTRFPFFQCQRQTPSRTGTAQTVTTRNVALHPPSSTVLYGSHATLISGRLKTLNNRPVASVKNYSFLGFLPIWKLAALDLQHITNQLFSLIKNKCVKCLIITFTELQCLGIKYRKLKAQPVVS